MFYSYVFLSTLFEMTARRPSRDHRINVAPLLTSIESNENNQKVAALDRFEKEL